jgi:NAD(P)H-dependent flavin oxidoreductase YrpB (nitropropane dioxygenase family)
MAPLSTRFTELVGIEHPIVQDGMGPFRTSKLAAAVSEAGGLGTVSIPGMTIEYEEGKRVLREHIDETVALTDKPFAVNVPVGVDDEGKMLHISEALISAVIEARAESDKIRDQLRVLTTSAGYPGEFRDRIRESGLIHMCKVGSTRQAERAAAAGADVIIASGYEMGGHTHKNPVHTFVLAANVCEVVDIPVLVSGGVRDGRGLAAAMCFGAAGIAMGTRFIATEENTDWHPNYRQRIIDAREGDDGVVPGVYAPARVMVNRGTAELMEVIEKGSMTLDELTVHKDELLKRAQIDGDMEHGFVAAGQVASGIREIVRIAEFVPAMADEAARTLTGLASTATADSAIS